MDWIGFAVGLAGLALAVLQYLNSFKNKVTLRNWGAEIIRRQKSAAEAFADLAGAAESADREEWRSMQGSIVTVLQRGTRDATDSVEEVGAFIRTVAAGRRWESVFKRVSGDSAEVPPA